MMNNDCPLCSNSEYTSNNSYMTLGSEDLNCSIVCCNSCLHFFTIMKDTIDIDKLYGQGAYKLLNTKGSFVDKVLKIENRFIINQLSKIKKSGRKLLDFGCGKGQFLDEASQNKWEVLGVETAEDRANFAREEYNLEVNSEKYAGGVLGNGPFDVITLFHVLEHLDKPKVLLRELCNKNLKDDGYLVIEVPLFDSLQSKLSGNSWIHLDPPLHISHFTKSSLVTLLNELNYTPKKFEYFSIHLGILGMTQAIMSLFGYKKMLISELKFRRTKLLMLSVILILPFSSCLEVLAVLLKKGGVIRVYSKKNED